MSEESRPMFPTAAATPTKGSTPRPMGTSFAVGERVLYVPNRCHAFERNTSGTFPWVVGKKVTSRGRGQKPEEVTQELTPAELRNTLDNVLKSRDRNREMEKLVLLRPAMLWDAVIRTVNSDGTCDLDIASPNGGVTLHCDGVPHDPLGTKAHSFKAKD